MDNTAVNSMNAVHIQTQLNDLTEALATIAESVKGIARQVQTGGTPASAPVISVTRGKSKRRASFTRQQVLDSLTAVLGNNFIHFIKA